MKEENTNAEEFALAMWEAMKEIRDPIKDSKNPHFRSTYASLEAVLDAIRPVLLKHKLFMIQSIKEAGIVLDVYHASGPGRSFGPMPIRTIQPGDGEQKQRNLAQEYKAAITLLRRTQLLAAFGLAEVDTDGNIDDHKPESKKADTDKKVEEYMGAMKKATTLAQLNQVAAETGKLDIPETARDFLRDVYRKCKADIEAAKKAEVE